MTAPQLHPVVGAVLGAAHPPLLAAHRMNEDVRRPPARAGPRAAPPVCAVPDDRPRLVRTRRR